MANWNPVSLEKDHWNRIAKEQAEAENKRYSKLPDFDPNSACVSCGAKGPEIEYKKPTVFSLHSGDEHYPTHDGTLKHTCGRCKRIWYTKTIGGEA